MKNIKRLTVVIFAFFILLPAMAQVKTGDEAPVFMANNQNGELWSSGNYYGKNYVVIYFYPAALTFGCTKQACSYRDAEKELKDMGVEVVGVSGDAVKNLKIFEKENNLNFTLLSDVNGYIANKFGVPISEGGVINKETKNGKVELARAVTAKRWTFIVDKNKKIVYVDKGVNPMNDRKKVIEFIKALE
jgi:peroxiredoxin Q/BCP